MAELLCLELSNKPVKHHLQEWLDAVQQLHAQGEWSRARLLLNTVLQARDDCVEAHVLLVQTLLHLGEPQWPKALQEARYPKRIQRRSAIAVDLQRNSITTVQGGSTLARTILSCAFLTPSRQQGLCTGVQRSLLFATTTPTSAQLDL